LLQKSKFTPAPRHDIHPLMSTPRKLCNAASTVQHMFSKEKKNEDLPQQSQQLTPVAPDGSVNIPLEPQTGS